MIYNESLLWEKGSGEGCGFSFNSSEIEDKLPISKHLRSEFKLPGFSEPEVARHFTRLSTWNYGIDTGIYPLGSCTMKYNPKFHEKIASLPGFSQSHPMQDGYYSQGVLEVMYKTGEALLEITGMDDITLQPAAGAHGELTAMLIFKEHFKTIGEDRNIILIPDSAHGTNPASAAICGFKTKIIKSGEQGILTTQSVKDLMDEHVAGIMITNPNTLGLFEKNILEICNIVHDYGGLVYADGANLNALMGIVKLGDTGVDALHMNLHKTFSTPHGGGGPGSGPLAVKKHLSPYLPVPKISLENGRYSFDHNNNQSIGKVHGFYGNFLVILKAYIFIRSLGPDGLKKVSETAVLNANYIKAHLKEYYHLPFNEDSLHEVLFTDNLSEKNGITTIDIAKALIEKGVHPPTIYFPLVVHGAMLIEPTESESVETLDNLISVFKEIASDAVNDPEKLKNAPLGCKRVRVDETLAARKPIIKGQIN